MLKKYSWISWIALTAASGMAYANEPAQTSTAETEVSVTSARVQQIIRQINERESQVDPATISSDFVTARAEFMRKIREGMPRFEQEVAEILGRLQPFKDRIRAIQLSTAYDEAQKASLIRLIENEINHIGLAMHFDYQKAILRAYTAAGEIPFAFTIGDVQSKRRWHWIDVTFSSASDSFTTELRYRHGSETERYYDGLDSYGDRYELREAVLNWAISQARIHDLVVPVVTRGCQTRTCMSLMLEEWRKYVEMVNTTIDQPLNTGMNRQLPRTDINLKSLRMFLNVGGRWENDLSIPFSN